MTKTATKRDDAKRARVTLDWQPSADLRTEFETQGVDVSKARAEFVRFWDDEAEDRNRKAFKSSRGWERAFRNRLEFVVAKGTAPMLPGRARITNGNGHWPEEPTNAEKGRAARLENERRAIEGR